MIEIKQNEVNINLNKKFYEISVVRESLKDFSQVCSGKIRNKKDIHIILKPKDKSLTNILGNEFCNYVLGLMKNKTLV